MTRTVLLVVPVLILLAGCASEVATCTNPSWTQGKSTSIFLENYPPESDSTTRTDILGEGMLTFLDHPLDRAEMNFHWTTDEQGRPAPRGIQVLDAVLRVTVMDMDGKILGFQENAQPFDQASPELVYEPGVYWNFTLNVALAAPTHEPDPRPIQVVWELSRNLDGDDTTVSTAAFHYEAKYWYRTCTP